MNHTKPWKSFVEQLELLKEYESMGSDSIEIGEKGAHLFLGEKENNTIQSCPKCGNSMVLREARKGPNIGKTF